MDFQPIDSNLLTGESDNVNNLLIGTGYDDNNQDLDVSDIDKMLCDNDTMPQVKDVLKDPCDDMDCDFESEQQPSLGNDTVVSDVSPEERRLQYLIAKGKIESELIAKEIIDFIVERVLVLNLKNKDLEINGCKKIVEDLVDSVVLNKEICQPIAHHEINDQLPLNNNKKNLSVEICRELVNEMIEKFALKCRNVNEKICNQLLNDLVDTIPEEVYKSRKETCLTIMENLICKITWECEKKYKKFEGEYEMEILSNGSNVSTEAVFENIVEENIGREIVEDLVSQVLLERRKVCQDIVSDLISDISKTRSKSSSKLLSIRTDLIEKKQETTTTHVDVGKEISSELIGQLIAKVVIENTKESIVEEILDELVAKAIDISDRATIGGSAVEESFDQATELIPRITSIGSYQDGGMVLRRNPRRLARDPLLVIKEEYLLEAYPDESETVDFSFLPEIKEEPVEEKPNVMPFDDFVLSVIDATRSRKRKVETEGETKKKRGRRKRRTTSSPRTRSPRVAAAAAAATTTAPTTRKAAVAAAKVIWRESLRPKKKAALVQKPIAATVTPPPPPVRQTVILKKQQTTPAVKPAVKRGPRGSLGIRDTSVQPRVVAATTSAVKRQTASVATLSINKQVVLTKAKTAVKRSATPLPPAPASVKRRLRGATSPIPSPPQQPQSQIPLCNRPAPASVKRLRSQLVEAGGFVSPSSSPAPKRRSSAVSQSPAPPPTIVKRNVAVKSTTPFPKPPERRSNVAKKSTAGRLLSPRREFVQHVIDDDDDVYDNNDDLIYVKEQSFVKETVACPPCKVALTRMPFIDRLLPNHNEGPNFCELCEPRRMFMSKSALVKHLKTDHGSELIPTAVTLNSHLQSQQPRHQQMAIVSPRPSAPASVLDYCPGCRLRFHSQNRLNTHMGSCAYVLNGAVTVFNLPFVCDLCERRFADIEDLVTHKKSAHLIHVKKQVMPQQLSVPDEQLPIFASQTLPTNNPNKIVMKFSREVFKCETCGMIFRTRGMLHDHELIHQMRIKQERRSSSPELEIIEERIATPLLDPIYTEPYEELERMNFLQPTPPPVAVVAAQKLPRMVARKSTTPRSPIKVVTTSPHYSTATKKTVVLRYPYESSSSLSPSSAAAAATSTTTTVRRS